MTLQDSKIDGPEVLCPVSTGTYKILSTYNSSKPNPDQYIYDVAWANSSNMSKVSQNNTLNTAVFQINYTLNPSWIQAIYKEKRTLQQFYKLEPEQDKTVTEVCKLTHEKPLFTDKIPDYQIKTNFDHCNNIYKLEAEGPDVSAYFEWRLDISYHDATGNHSTVRFFAGKIVNFNWMPGDGGFALITLRIVTDQCGESTDIGTKDYVCQHAGSPPSSRMLVLSPNPANTHVNIGITDNYLINAGGIDVNFIRNGTAGITSINRIYYNGQSINIGSLPNGTYTVQVLVDNTNLNSTLVVDH